MSVLFAARHTNLIGFWKDVYGYRMSCLQHEVVKEPMVEVVPKGSIITTNSVLTDLDLYTCSVNSVNFCADFRLDVTADGELTAFVGFFDVFFDLPHAVSFSTGPHSEPTHWKQIVFFLEEPVLFKKGNSFLLCIIITTNIEIKNVKKKGRVQPDSHL